MTSINAKVKTLKIKPEQRHERMERSVWFFIGKLPFLESIEFDKHVRCYVLSPEQKSIVPSQ
jgi:hypothetical protein